jgi:eukaryotic-like serine/threonine-protein kinase
MIGKSILHYKIIEKLGEGGMGIVYLAQDTKLERHVAIKFLPSHIAAISSDRERFKIEAQAAAALNHPNIATIHAIEEQDDQIFIVMEYIEGKELKEIINDPSVSPLAKGGVRGVLDYAIQIAKGLHSAHKKGIIHRDIKSSNIMVTEDGNVKIMDFGLARIGEGMQLTRTNSTMGTVSYMSPEQVQGESAGPQSDIWSFGVVLFELLTGKQPFEGKNEPAIIYAITNNQPDLRQIENESLKAIVAKCLQKDKKDRYQSVAQLLKDLQTEKEPSSIMAQLNVKAVGKSGIHSTTFKWIAAISFIFLISLYFILFDIKQSTILPPMQTIRLTSYAGQEIHPALSPDGQSIAFAWNGPGQDNFDIYVRRVDGGNPVRLTTDTRDDVRPEWSPDGSRIAFVRKGEYESIIPDTTSEIYIIPSLGGLEQKVTDFSPQSAGPMTTICWSKDNKFIYFSSWAGADNNFAIFKIELETHKWEKVTHSNKTVSEESPRISPDGNLLAFIRVGNGKSTVYIKRLHDQEIQRFANIDVWIHDFCWCKDSRSIIYSGSDDGTSSLWKVDFESNNPEKIISGANINKPYLSATGERLVYAETLENTNIWKLNLNNPEEETLLIGSSTFINTNANISPDGKRILFASDRTGTRNIWICESDGNNQTRLTENLYTVYAVWSPDGSEILICHFRYLYLMNAFGGLPKRINNEYKEGTWSIDGSLLYAIRTFEENQIFLLSKDGVVQKQITKNNGHVPKVYENFVYYVKTWFNKDIWRVPLNGGAEEPVLQGVADMALRSWAVVKNGIYYIRKNNGSPVLDFFDFKTKKISRIKKVPMANIEINTTIDVDPEEQYLLYSKDEPTKSDIILVENFRTE